MKNKNVAVFTGTRADYGLLFWLLKDIQNDPELTLQLLVTGSHLSGQFGNTYQKIEKDGFVIDEKIEILLSSNTPAAVAKSIGLGVLGFTDALVRLKPDIMVILGDRYEALAAAQTAMVLGIPILHLHGGEISEGAYDDNIRHAITKLSYVHGVSSEVHRKRVIQLGEAPERVFTVGALGLDHLKKSTLMSLEALSASLDFALSSPYIVVTYHPVTAAHEDPRTSMCAILKALDNYPRLQVILTYPNADHGGQEIIPLLEAYRSKAPERVLTIPSLGHIRYLSAVKHCVAVVGNSSSGIIEVPSFDVPTVNVGVRQKGRLAAKSVINCHTTTHEICDAIDVALEKKYKAAGEKIVNPYGQGHSSEKVLKIIKRVRAPAFKTFFDVEVDGSDINNC